MSLCPTSTWFVFAGSAILPPSYFEKDLVAYLNTLGLPVYPGRIPQRKNVPAITFFLVYGDHGTQLSGASGIATGHYQIGVSSTRYDDVGQISEQLRLALFKIRYFLGQTYVFSGVLGNQISRYDPPPTDNDKGIHTKINEFTFQYQESIPS
jgi:hypothetical protein